MASQVELRHLEPLAERLFPNFRNQRKNFSQNPLLTSKLQSSRKNHHRAGVPSCDIPRLLNLIRLISRKEFPSFQLWDTFYRRRVCFRDAGFFPPTCRNTTCPWIFSFVRELVGKFVCSLQCRFREFVRKFVCVFFFSCVHKIVCIVHKLPISSFVSWFLRSFGARLASQSACAFATGERMNQLDVAAAGSGATAASASASALVESSRFAEA